MEGEEQYCLCRSSLPQTPAPSRSEMIWPWQTNVYSCSTRPSTGSFRVYQNHCKGKEWASTSGLHFWNLSFPSQQTVPLPASSTPVHILTAEKLSLQFVLVSQSNINTFGHQLCQLIINVYQLMSVYQLIAIVMYHGYFVLSNYSILPSSVKSQLFCSF